MSASPIQQCATIVLAAGKSSRLGTPKQLLDYQGKSLLELTVEKALATKLGPVVVVVGANGELVKNQLEQFPVTIVVNEAWEEGMASSIRAGINEVLGRWEETDGLMILVCDQPLLETTHLHQLLKVQHQVGASAVASSYQDRLGTPALFHFSLFEELKNLKGDAGARKILGNPELNIASVPFEDGAFDIDTKEDYERLLNIKKTEP
jgi:molybdenum cofactor cytidylyltransferase